jgi:hypothetical protein
MNHTFHSADQATYRKTLLVSVLCCAFIVWVLFLVKPHSDSRFVVMKATKVTRTAGQSSPAN